MYKLTYLIVILFIFNCSFFQRQQQGTREVDGIVYIDEEEYKKMQKSREQATDQTNQPNADETNPQTARTSTQSDGILYLSDDDQPEVTSDQAIEPSSNIEKGQASYYANKFKGSRTASGEIYDPDKMTGAHRTLPFGTMVRVMNLDNKKIVTVKINDRGPHIQSRIIDLSYAAAEKLDIIRKGISEVAIEVVK